jgi:peptidoglycan/LPS O-acetylase OafA/YrhL
VTHQERAAAAGETATRSRRLKTRHSEEIPRNRMRPQASGTARLPVADSLRGLAALWVVLFHAFAGRHITALTDHLPVVVTRVVFEWGELGVAAFFVLSGLVISHTTGGLDTQRRTVREFIGRRVLRMTPPYYFAICFALVMLAVKAMATGKPVSFPGWTDLVAHLLYVQELVDVPEINSVFWTLGIELQFYLVFGAMMLAARWTGSPAAVLGVAALVALLPPLGAFPWLKWYGWFLPTWHAFILGVLVHQARAGGPAWAYVGYASVLGVLAIVYESMFTGVAVVASALLAAALRWGPLLRDPRPLAQLGAVSYSLYLLHVPLTGAVFWVSVKVLGSSAGAELAGLLATIAASIAVAAAAYRWVEQPAIRWGRSLRVATA